MNNKIGKAKLKKLSERKRAGFREEKDYIISAKPLFDSCKIPNLLLKLRTSIFYQRILCNN